MSERIQRKAKNRSDAAHQREQNARQRAEASENRGDQVMARIHRSAAEHQADAASIAETLMELDRKQQDERITD